MIQRKQTLWLLLAAVCCAGVFYFDLYRYTGGALRVNDHYPSLLVALVITVLPFVNIFLFRNRKRQSRMCAAAILADVAFLALLLGRVTGLGKLTPPPTGGTYWIGSVLPVISLILVIIAMTGIRKDEKLVRSTDRLR